MAGAGDLDRRIRIEQATETRAPGSGELVKTWTPVYVSWAGRRDPRPSEAFQAEQFAAKARYTFRIRYRDGITPGRNHRLVDLSDNGRVYDIQSVAQPFDRRRYLDLVCEARAE